MTTRQPTPIDAVADAHFDAVTLASPIAMTWLGMDERQDEYDDMSPVGRDGAGFSLKAFHATALNLGSVGLGTLRDAMLA